MIDVESHIISPSGVVTTGMPPFQPSMRALGVDAQARAQPPRLALVVEVTRDLAREVGDAQAVNDVALAVDHGLPGSSRW